MARAIPLAQKSSNFDNSNKINTRLLFVQKSNCSFVSTVERKMAVYPECTEVFVMGIRYTFGRHCKVELGAILAFSTF